MTNTHINIGGHKITTNKVGQVHTVTSLENGFSGTITWCVINGICMVNSSIQRANTGTNLTVYTSLPKAKMGGNVPAYNNRGSIYITTLNDTQLMSNVLVTNANLYASLTYPVADDWVES